MRCWHREGFTRASSSWFGRWGPWGPAWNRGRPTQSVVSSERQVWPGRRSLYIRRVNSDGYEAPATARSRLGTYHDPRFPKRVRRVADATGTARSRRARVRVFSRTFGLRGSRGPQRRVAPSRPAGTASPGRDPIDWPSSVGRARGGARFRLALLSIAAQPGCHAREAEFEKNLSYSQDTTLNSNANRYASSPGRSSTASLRAITDQGSQYSNTQCSQHTSSQARMAPERYVWCSRA